MLEANLSDVRRRITACCEKIGRPTQDVKLVCVTKEASIDEIRRVMALGVEDLGENRVQDTLLKSGQISPARWHLVGHLQTNKVKDAIRIFSLIHSVDSIRLAKEIDKEAAKLNKVQDILIQVNTSGEVSKFGIAPDKACDLFREIAGLGSIKVSGLMTIAPAAKDPESVRPYFRAIRELRDKVNGSRVSGLGLQELSMGMSDDFEAAIEEGATMIRVGRAIFAPRVPAASLGQI